MKSDIKKIGNTVIVNVDGTLDYETQAPFKKELSKIAEITSGKQENDKTDEVAKDIVFNFKNLEFVGSSGITQFIETLKEFTTGQDQKARILDASSEFKKVIQAYDPDQMFEFVETQSDQKKNKKRETTQ